MNHVDAWNPSDSIERTEVDLGPLEASDGGPAALEREVLQRLDLPEEHRSAFQPAPGELQIHAAEETIFVDLAEGTAVRERVSERPVLFQRNFLHLNHAKKLWSWVADAFALALILLACTGIFLPRGKQGLAGRGKWLVAAGFGVPIFFLWPHG